MVREDSCVSINICKAVPCAQIFSNEFMKENKIEANCEVVSLDGPTFKKTIMKNMTFSEHVPESDEFVVYQFMRSKEKKHRKLFKCTHEGTCSKVFVSVSKLFSHMMSHTDDKPYKCPHLNCNVSFGYKGNLNKHIKARHEGIKRYQCHHCPKSFFRRDNL